MQEMGRQNILRLENSRSGGADAVSSRFGTSGGDAMIDTQRSAAFPDVCQQVGRGGVDGTAAAADGRGGKGSTRPMYGGIRATMAGELG